MLGVEVELPNVTLPNVVDVVHSPLKSEVEIVGLVYTV